MTKLHAYSPWGPLPARDIEREYERRHANSDDGELRDVPPFARTAPNRFAERAAKATRNGRAAGAKP